MGTNPGWRLAGWCSSGRFASPDPLGIFAADLTNPQSLNRYAYVRNNPLNLVDPSGMDCIDPNGEPDPLLGDPSECTSGGGIWDNTSYCDFSGVYGCDSGPGFGGIEVGGVSRPYRDPRIGSQPFPDPTGRVARPQGASRFFGCPSMRAKALSRHSCAFRCDEHRVVAREVEDRNSGTRMVNHSSVDRSTNHRYGPNTSHDSSIRIPARNRDESAQSILRSSLR
jgi:hypothetical protein